MSSHINVISSLRSRRAPAITRTTEGSTVRSVSSAWRAAAAPATVVLTGLGVWLLGGAALAGSLTAIGMSLDQGRLLATLLVVMVAAAVGAAAAGRRWVRTAALAVLVVIEIVPTLWAAVSSLHAPGVLLEHPDIVQWFLQPVGLLLMGLVVATIGCGTGTLLRRDVAKLAHLLSMRPRFMAVLLVASLLAIGGGPAASGALQAGPKAQLIGVNVDTAGGAGRLEHRTISGRETLVYVPAAHDRSPSLRLPVLYLLHGFPASPSDWTGDGQIGGILDQLITSATIPPLFAVMPDGNGDPVSDSEWANNAAGDRLEAWVIGDLVPAINAGYPTLGAACAGIAGYSSGGFGAVNLALRHPGSFSWAASYSGYFVAPTASFGAAGLANSPLWSAQRLAPAQRMPLFLGAGASDPTFRAATREFAAVLETINWPEFKVDEVPGGHGWGAWRPLAVDSLTWLGQLWTGTTNRAVPACAPAYD